MLSNALKFTAASGSIRITLSLETGSSSVPPVGGGANGEAAAADVEMMGVAATTDVPEMRASFSTMPCAAALCSGAPTRCMLKQVS